MLRGVIKSFKTGDYAVTRRGAGSYVKGRYVEAASSTFSISANVQPAGPRTLMALAEAFHTTDAKLVFTKTQLYSRTPAQASDKISIDGETYTVVKVEYWPAFGDSHYRVTVAIDVEGAL